MYRRTVKQTDRQTGGIRLYNLFNMLLPPLLCIVYRTNNHNAKHQREEKHDRCTIKFVDTRVNLTILLRLHQNANRTLRECCITTRYGTENKLVMTSLRGNQCFPIQLCPALALSLASPMRTAYTLV